MDTIFALASARGRSGVAVIRVSGPRSWDVARKLSGALPRERELAYRVFRADDGAVLDSGLLVIFAQGRSFTGEASAEFMIHGGVASVAAFESALARFPGVRLADAGEFTRRALLAGRLDLTQVEALADLIDAETETQRKQALRLLDGALGRRVSVWRSGLLRAAALIETGIDFVEEDLGDFGSAAKESVEGVLTEIAGELRGFSVRERIRAGFQIALVGPVNSGKSTLLNALAKRDVAITSSVAGTTRDVIEVQLDIGGYSVALLDTAGIRETADEIERIGVKRAQDRAASADLRIVFVDEPEARPVLDLRSDDIVIIAKGDRFPDVPGAVSGLTGQGIDWLVAQIEVRLAQGSADGGVTVRARHRLALEDAASALGRALDLLEKIPYEEELVAFELRSAMRSLDMLIGRVDVEDLLDDIFSSFCIGK